MATANHARFVRRSNGFHRAAEDGPYLIYGPQLGQEASEGMRPSLVMGLVFGALAFGAVAGFGLGFVARGPKKE